MKSVSTSSASPFKKYILSVFLTFGITIILMLLLSAVLTFFDLSDNVRKMLTPALSFISAFLSGFFASRKTNRSGYLTGTIASVIYAFIIIVISCAFFNGPFLPSYIAKTILRSIPFGLLGGIAGINSK